MKYFSYEISKTLTRLKQTLAHERLVVSRNRKFRDYAAQMELLEIYWFEGLE